jgi:hypothetical protein
MSPIESITCPGGASHRSTPTKTTLSTTVPSTRTLARFRSGDTGRRAAGGGAFEVVVESEVAGEFRNVMALSVGPRTIREAYPEPLMRNPSKLPHGR